MCRRHDVIQSLPDAAGMVSRAKRRTDHVIFLLLCSQRFSGTPVSQFSVDVCMPARQGMVVYAYAVQSSPVQARARYC